MQEPACLANHESLAAERTHIGNGLEVLRLRQIEDLLERRAFWSFRPFASATCRRMVNLTSDLFMDYI